LFKGSGFALRLVKSEMANVCGMQLILKKWKTGWW